MYQNYFGLTEAPFSIAVNPRYLFMSARHRDALAHLLYGVGTGGGFILLTGEVGTGKTTINRCLLEQLPDDTDIAIILNPALDAMELLASVCDELDIPYEAGRNSLKTLTDKLHTFLLGNHALGRKTVLMIDEAQHLDVEVLEQIRLLTNLETNREKLLQIVLIGQPELAAMLQRPELRQLNQRITARYNLEPLRLEETRAYIRHRLQVAGLTGDRELFPASAVRAIHRHTRGIPRLINVLCDRTLLGAYGQNRSRADRALVATAADEVLGTSRRRWQWQRWTWPLVLGAVVVGFAALWLKQSPIGAPLRLPAPAASGSVVPATVATDPPAAEATASTMSGKVSAAGPDPVSAATTATAETVQQQESESAWVLSPERAAEQLWSLHAVAEIPRHPCPPGQLGGVACHRGSAQTWDALEGFDRPLVLELVTPGRFRGAALLLGLDGRQARLVTAAGGVAEIPLSELAALWHGDFYVLWQPPEGFSGPLALGDEGAVVAEVARMLAQIDGQREPLAGEHFNAALQTRVRLFQQANGLEADGVVGVRTLLELNEQLGIDISRSLALSRLHEGGST